MTIINKVDEEESKAITDSNPIITDTSFYPSPSASAAAPPALGELVSRETTLDPDVVALLDNVDTFYIQQQVQWIEALTQGCIEQPNIYAVIDKSTNTKIMMIREESESCNRCFCAPLHSLYAKFYLTDSTGMPTGLPVMTLEREGCDCCCTGPCPKPCLCCFACQKECSEKASFYSGDINFQTSKPGAMKGTRETTALIGESVQPLGGGRFRPIVQIMDRGTGDGGKTTTEMFAAARGPCLFGGCSEFCVDSKFGISIAKPGSTVTEMHELPFGDFASITKQRPRTFQGAMRELFTDSDIYEVTFHSKHITPQQKANVLATMVHLEYMFFERDNDMFYCEGNKLHINLFNCFIYGCVCPCEIVLNGES